MPLAFYERRLTGASQDAFGRMILIAERDRNVRELEQHFLERAGFSVEFADDGAVALTRSRLALPQLVITEILIAKLDGLQLCRELKQDPTTRDIPVIVFSVLAAEARAKEAGANAFLRKPLVPSVLLGTIQRLVALEAHSLTESQ
ncbi:MAG: response regulator [Gemmatimonadaceae bacterium]